MLPAVKIKNLCRQKAKKPYHIGAAFSLLVQHPQTPSNLFCSSTKQSYTPVGLKTGVTIKTKTKNKTKTKMGKGKVKTEYFSGFFHPVTVVTMVTISGAPPPGPKFIVTTVTIVTPPLPDAPI